MRCDGDRFNAVNRAIPDVLEGPFHDFLGALGHRLSQVKLELAQLVAAKCHAGAVVTFDESATQADCLAEVGHGLQRRRHVTETGPG